MKFFVDTADISEIRELAAAGFLDGVTTNPSLDCKDRSARQGRHQGDLPGNRGSGVRGSHRDRL